MKLILAVMPGAQPSQPTVTGSPILSLGKVASLTKNRTLRLPGGNSATIGLPAGTSSPTAVIDLLDAAGRPG